jgi:hypothetical protein
MNILRDHDVTVVSSQIQVWHQTGGISDFSPRIEWPELVTVTASAKRHPTDKHDPETALLLAQARMYEKLAKKLFRQANGRIKHADDMRLDKTRRRKARKPKTVEEAAGKGVQWVKHG